MPMFLTVGRPKDAFEQEAHQVARETVDERGAHAPEADASPTALPAYLRTYFERRLRADLGGVRLHTGREAVEKTGALGAHALTSRDDIYFNDGRYRQTGGSGLALLAHELTHVAQQRRGGAPDIQAEFPDDFGERAELPAAAGAERPPGAIRVSNSRNEEVFARQRIYPISEIPGAYDRLEMTSHIAPFLRNPEKNRAELEALGLMGETRVSVGHLRVYESQLPANLRVMIASYDGEFHLVGFDQYEPNFLDAAGRYMDQGYVEAQPGTRYVGQLLLAERIMRLFEASVERMRLEVGSSEITDPARVQATREYHQRLRQAAGLSGEVPAEYFLGTREMARLLAQWGQLPQHQQTLLRALALEAEPPTVAQVQAVLRGGSTPPGGGGGSSGPPSGGGGGGAPPGGGLVFAPVWARPFRGPGGQTAAAEAESPIRRLETLTRAEEILTRYGNFVVEQHRHTEAVRQARQALFRSLLSRVSLEVAGRQPVEDLLTPYYMQQLEEVNRLGPHLETLTREMERARTTGRMSPAGVEALWEVSPEMARQLVGASGMSRREQRQTLSQLPGQGMPAGTRAAAGFMIAFEVFNLAAPIIGAQRRSAYDSDVRAALEDIVWWQSKGVLPEMQALDDNWWPYENEWTTEPARVGQLLSDREVSYLALTSIPDSAWDAFTIWVSTHVLNIRDWYAYIVDSNAIRGDGPSITELSWSYRRNTIEEGTVLFSLSEHWQHSPRLTTILQAAASAVVSNTEQELEAIAAGPGELFHGAYVAEGSSTPVYGTMPQATGRKRFRRDIEEPTLYTLRGQRARTGYSRDTVFYTFPDSAAEEPVPGDYVVVGGADFNSYVDTYSTRNLVTGARRSPGGEISTYERPLRRNTREVLLARRVDLEDAPP